MFAEKMVLSLTVLAVLLLPVTGCKDVKNVNSQNKFIDNTVSEIEESESKDIILQNSSTEPEIKETELKPETNASSAVSHVHSFKQTVVKPTCTAGGYTLNKCICGESTLTNSVAKKGHSFEEWVLTKQSTASSFGEQIRKCSVCGVIEKFQIAKLVPQLTDDQKKIFELTNNERGNRNLPALTYRHDIQLCADIRAKEVVDCWSHTRPNGKIWYSVIEENGFKLSAGENLGRFTNMTVEDLVNGWMLSPGHRDNILKKEYTGIAVGAVKKGDEYFFVQIFVK